MLPTDNIISLSLSLYPSLSPSPHPRKLYPKETFSMCRTSRHRRVRCRETKVSTCRLTCQRRYSTKWRREVSAPSAGTQEKISRYSEQGLRHPKTLYVRGCLPEIETGQHASSLSLRSVLSCRTFPFLWLYFAWRVSAHDGFLPQR